MNLFKRTDPDCVTAEEVAKRPPQKLAHIVRSLNPEQCDEAVKAFDDQGDQVVFQSEFLARLTSNERQSLAWRHHWDALFWFCFGYACAKGWTDMNRRLNARADAWNGGRA